MTIDIPESRKLFARYAAELPNFYDRDAVPGVSAILALRFGPVPDAPWIQAAAHRGKLVHLACELYDRDDLDVDSISGSAEMMGYLRGWQRWCEREPGEWEQIEHPLYATVDEVTFCGVVDRIGFSRGICDIKTRGNSGRRPVYRSDEWWRVGLQLAGYGELVAATPEGRVDRRRAIYLWPDGRVHVEDFTPYNDEMDAEWRQLLRLWREQRQVAAEEERCP